jgi:addiction module RelE/StbE family toxin
VPSLIYSEQALDDLERVAEFLAKDDPAAAGATAPLITQALEVLEAHPLIGRTTDGELRELIISRGRSGYIALYEYHAAADRIIVHGIRHQREAGFEEV